MSRLDDFYQDLIKQWVYLNPSANSALERAKSTSSVSYLMNNNNNNNDNNRLRSVNTMSNIQSNNFSLPKKPLAPISTNNNNKQALIRKEEKENKVLENELLASNRAIKKKKNKKSKNPFQNYNLSFKSPKPLESSDNKNKSSSDNDENENENENQSFEKAISEFFVLSKNFESMHLILFFLFYFLTLFQPGISFESGFSILGFSFIISAFEYRWMSLYLLLFRYFYVGMTEKFINKKLLRDMIDNIFLPIFLRFFIYFCVMPFISFYISGFTCHSIISGYLFFPFILSFVVTFVKHHLTL
eukprot:TRINITY_DN2431_c1_g1_i1.p1 TRINITY_DN2431_c1_g1~~TRINITY_DN2431_c1_g1_i1.p1  ORF type:complete len:301 (+),score=75.57 TRINITY_DN2431_c1_g1_i1:23-925(+)